MAEAYGASQEAWHHWSEVLGLTEHLLPVVANPGAKISPDSNMRGLGKTPSRYNFRGEVSGFHKWTEQRTLPREIAKWEMEPDYGICVQSREGGLQAIDIDVPNERHSARIVEAIEKSLPTHPWNIRRTREGTGKLLIPFRYAGGALPKAVLHVEGGMVEVLGAGQQWIADSSYITAGESASGLVAQGRYMWPAGRPQRLSDLPVLDDGDLEELRDTLDMLFAVPDARGQSGWKIARLKREGTLVDTSPRPGGDPVSNWLIENWEIRDEGRSGELFIRCPFDAEHTSDSGPTETVYYPAGTGGYEKGHFKCLHAHCMARSDDDYLTEVGYSIADEFPIIEVPEGGDEGGAGGAESGGNLPEKGGALRYIVDNKGRKENRAYNHEVFLSSDDCPVKVRWDNFTANIIKAPSGDREGEERWSLFSDEHYSHIVRQMDRHGFVPQSPSAIRPAVHSHAMLQSVDSAMLWAERLPEWDGVERVERFWVTYAGVADTAYARAVGRYSWTAQAGRLLDPGCQVDMTPILVGEQGARKTSLIAAIAPTRQWFTEINLLERDDDTSRKMRGKLVAELGELRGMHARDKEDVKAFLTRREEEWVPKYQEFAKSFKRRFVFYGSTNRDDFLADETGERRYLPMRVGSELDVEGVERDRDQLWAEAIARYREYGIEWQDAERLAKAEHGQFKAEDPWTREVVDWLLTPGALSDPELAPVDMPYQWGINDVLVGALGRKKGELSHGLQTRVGAILKSLGCWKKQARAGDRVVRVFRAFREKLEAEDDLYQ